MITPLNTVSSETVVRYMLVQHIPNPMRKEPRNVGVLVEKNGKIESRFVGETDSQKWDSSRLRSFASPSAYRLWVDRWRKIAIEAGEGWDQALLNSVRRNAEFVVIPGGEVTQTASDSPEEICQYLYGLLISRGGLSEALEEDSEASSVLKSDITSTFRGAEILAGANSVKYPVYANRDVRGTTTWHRLGFYQERENEAWAMEPVDFTVQRKSLARDHSAYAQYVFSDLRARSEANGLNIHTAALIRVSEEDSGQDDVKKGIEILEDSCQIVHWLDENERSKFVNERISMAHALQRTELM